MSNNWKRNCRIALAGLGVVAFAAVFAVEAKAANAPLIAVFTKNNTNPAYAAARRGVDLVAREKGATTAHFVPESPDNVEQQKALVVEALAQKPDLVIFVPVDDKAMVEDAAKFTQAGIPVVSFVNRLEGEFVAHVGSDDVAVGYNGAKALFEGMDGAGKVLAIEGNPAAPTSRNRVAGMKKAADEFPDIEVLEIVTGMYQKPAAYNVTVEALRKHPEIDGIWAANDVMVYGALDAMKEADRSAKLVGANGLDGAIRLIEEGTMLATVEFSAFKIACTAARAGLRHLNGEDVPADITVPSVLIDSRNLEPWKVPLEERDCPSWEEIVRP
ncbi:sugar ABC transporter substrate-binding protein [Roseibium aggregatum]|uniref:Sugar ABC transporter substrate-binding protein n=1 Tax=Roseibium aggregatum TaxID=187304 RepID=A0A939J5A0_9HYPH|nr:sugar ABC transporter substrate-binding protein [Roseibium aggregatum]MBN9671519.1 sugar ABC transporter substrate-binding protein [Roseibium aggregatum]